MRPPLLLSIALFGLFVPNGMFFYYIFTQFTDWHQVTGDLLALGFIIDAFMATGLLAWWFAKNPPLRYGWKTFVVLSLIGGLGFSLPFFHYLNRPDEQRQ